MATIKAFIRTSTKNKLVHIRIRLSDGRDFTRYGITNVVIFPEYWDNKREEVKARAVLPKELNRDVINNGIREAKTKIDEAYSKVKNKHLLSDNWIENILNKKIEIDKCCNASQTTLFDIYISEVKVSKARVRHLLASNRMLERFMKIYKSDFSNSEDVRKFEIFLRDEHIIQSKYPSQYEGVKNIKPRGQNTINSKLKMVSAFFSWAVKNKHLDYHPFSGYEYSPDVYGDPIPLLPDEVDLLYNAKLKGKMALIRDMFCLQCYLGCRVNDFVKLKKENVNDDILSYVANKTLEKRATTIYVPLIDNARRIIEKYNCEDGRLLPFINIEGEKGYNKSIKKLLETQNITRSVVVINPVTRLPEVKKICEVVSSHTARRTFINSNYRETQDPALIAKMTGHSEDSRAFSRYRNIDIDILREQMKKAFKK